MAASSVCIYAYFLVVLSVLKSFCCFVGFSTYAQCDDPKVGGTVLKTCAHVRTE